MNKLLFKFFLPALFVALVVSCKSNDEDNPENAYQQKIFLNEKAKAVVTANNSFGFNLFKTVNEATEETKNIVISPLSVSMALGMTMNGAESDTRVAMESTLGFEGYDLRGD